MTNRSKHRNRSRSRNWRFRNRKSRSRSRQRRHKSSKKEDHLREPNRTSQKSSSKNSPKPSSRVSPKKETKKRDTNANKNKDSGQAKKKIELQTEACKVYLQCRQTVLEVIAELKATLTRQIDKTFDLLLIEARMVNGCSCDQQMVKKDEECSSTQEFPQKTPLLSSSISTLPTKKTSVLPPKLTSTSSKPSAIISVLKRKLGPFLSVFSQPDPPAKKIRLPSSNLVTIPLINPLPTNLNQPTSLKNKDNNTPTQAPFINGVLCPIFGCHASRLGDVFKYYSHVYTMHFRRTLRCPVPGCKVAFGTFSLHLLDHHDDRRHPSTKDVQRKCPHCGLAFASFTTFAFHAFDVHAQGEWHCGKASGCKFIATTRAEWMKHEEECVTSFTDGKTEDSSLLI